MSGAPALKASIKTKTERVGLVDKWAHAARLENSNGHIEVNPKGSLAAVDRQAKNENNQRGQELHTLPCKPWD